MITCKEIDDYIAYCKEHPKWINRDRKLLIRNVVKPTLKRKDVRFDNIQRLPALHRDELLSNVPF